MDPFPLPVPDWSSILKDSAKGNKSEENFEDFDWHVNIQDTISAHPLIQEFRVKLVNPKDGSSSLIDSLVIYTRKKKRLIRELDELTTNINYDGKVGRRVSKFPNDES